MPLIEPGFETPRVGWTCECASSPVPVRFPCASGPGEHEGSALLLPPRCSAWQDRTDFDPARSLSLEVRSTGGGWARAFLGGSTAEDHAALPMDRRTRNATRTVAANAPGSESRGRWRTLSTREPLDTTDLAVVRVALVNDLAVPVHFDDVRLVVEGPNPLPVTGALLAAEHRSTWRIVAGVAPLDLWLPLPLDAAGQVPLSVSVAVDPIAPLTYATDEVGNWGVTATFPPAYEAEQVELTWSAIVLSRRLATAELAAHYAAEVDPARWRAASPVADAEDPAIVRIATALRAEEPEGTLTNVLGWTSAHVSPRPHLLLGFELDASRVVRGAGTSCTGYANVAAALGRAAGLPTRIVAGYLTGRVQQTHYVDEAWLGPARGWARFEPQGRMPIPEDALVTVRRVLPEEEGPDAMAPGRVAAPGVPLRSLLEPSGDRDRLRWAEPSRPFPDCARCDHAASVLAPLLGNPDRVRVAFARARAAWRADLPAVLDGALPAERAAKRADAETAKDLDDLERWLAALE